MSTIWRRPDEETIKQWVEACEDNSERLTSWETNFVEACRSRIDHCWQLTDSMVQKLETIYAERTP